MNFINKTLEILKKIEENYKEYLKIYSFKV